MRPEAPVPGTLVRSTSFSFAILRTSGEERTRSPTATAEAGAAGGGAAAGVAAMGAAAVGAAAAGTADFPAAPPMTATMVLMVTAEPSETLISERTTATGDRISASTLSVAI